MQPLSLPQSGHMPSPAVSPSMGRREIIQAWLRETRSARRKQHDDVFDGTDLKYEFASRDIPYCTLLATKPVKHATELEFGEVPIIPQHIQRADQIPGDITSLFQTVKAIAASQSVIPAKVAEQIRERLGVFDPDILDHNMTKEYPVDESRLDAEIDELKNISSDSVMFSKYAVFEPAWNDAVHGRLLAAAVAPWRNHVRFLNVTTLNIHPNYLPLALDVPASSASDNSSRPPPPPGAGSLTVDRAMGQTASASDLGSTMAAGNAPLPPPMAATQFQAKRVDYVLYLEDEATQDAARELLRNRDYDTGAPSSINHLDYAFLALRPITVSIETKSPDGQATDGLAQLSVWAAAQMLRLRELRRRGAPAITLPLLLVLSPSWKLLFIVDKGHCMVCHEFPNAVISLPGNAHLAGLVP